MMSTPCTAGAARARVGVTTAPADDLAAAGAAAAAAGEVLDPGAAAGAPDAAGAPRALTDVVVAVDREWRVTYANAVALRVAPAADAGAPPALVGRELWEVWPAARGTAFESAYRAAMDARTATQVAEHYAPLGRWFETRAFPTPDGGLLLVSTDVTERRAAVAEREALLRTLQAERAAAEAAARWARFLSRATESLTTAADTRDVLEAAGARAVPAIADFCQVFLAEPAGPGAPGSPGPHGTLRRAALRAVDPGVTAALQALEARGPVRVAGETLQARVFRSQEPTLVREVADALLVEIAEDAEHLALMRQVGYTSLLVVPLSVAGAALGVLVLGLTGSEQRFTPADRELAVDFARRVALAYDRARLYDRARAAQAAAETANKTKSDFLATMSHELRTPLSAVIGYAELLSDGVVGAPAEPQRAPLRRIVAGARHLLALIEDILEYAKVDVGRAEQVRRARADAAALGREVAEMLEPSVLQHALDFDVRIPAHPLPVVTDARRLRQILLNLLGNAVRYTERGAITFAVSPRDDGAVEFVVADTGIGIAAEHRARIFEPFWQVDQSHVRRRGGTGLGLAVSRRLAHALGGEIHVDSALGVGSTFTLVVPAAGPAPSDAGAGAAAGDAAGARAPDGAW
jgi:signal transduction histidine kinase